MYQAQLDPILKILLYAPGNETGFHGVVRIFDDLQINWRQNDDDIRRDKTSEDSTEQTDNRNSWLLLPMESKVDLQSSDLGDLLEHALDRAREEQRRIDESDVGPVVFLGMDSPVLPLEDIVSGLTTTSSDDAATTTVTSTITRATLCPADDGGYGMLSVPATADSKQTFAGVQWSHSLTAVSQLKALTDQGIPIQIGTLMHDVDEPKDVQRLCERLGQQGENLQEATTTTTATTKTMTEGESRESHMVLDRPSVPFHYRRPSLSTTTEKKDGDGISSIVVSSHESCYYTRHALIQAGLLQ